MAGDEENANAGASFLRPPKFLNINGPMPITWKNFMQQYEWFAEAAQLNKKSESIQVATFMSSLGIDAVNIFNSFNLTKDDSKKLVKIKAKFNEYFEPKLNITFERYEFNKMVQDETSFDEFLTKIQLKAKYCDFKDLNDDLVRDKIVVGITNGAVREKLLEIEDLTLAKAIQICRVSEITTKQLNKFDNTQIKTVDNILCRKYKNNTKPENTSKNSAVSEKVDKSRVWNCKHCGTIHGRKSCPAYQKTCDKCKHKGHFAKFCYSKKVNLIGDENKSIRDDAIDPELENELSNFCVNSITNKDNENSYYEAVKLNDAININFKLDTGAQCNVLPKTIVDKIGVKIDESQTKRILTFGDHPIEVVGESLIDCIVRNKNCKLKFIVVDANVSPILGKTECEKLKLIVRVSEIEGAIFEGLGCLKDYEYDIDLIDDPKFQIFPARTLAITLREETKKYIEEAVKAGVLIKTQGATPAVSPMVVVRRNGKLRVCVDLTHVNKNILRRYHPLCTIEEIATRIQKAKYFTLLDCKKGFWQIRVSERTEKYLTMATPWGRYSFKRLPFGLASAPEVFQDRMSQILEEFENTEVSMDDILIYAETKEKLRDITNRVVRKLNHVGLKLNKEKCIFEATEIKFLGHRLNENGLSADPDKIQAINNLKEPTNKKELQRILGMATYLGKFIDNLSGITQPLRALLHKKVEFLWTEEQEAAFRVLKQKFSTKPVLKFFDAKADVTLQVDSSSKSFGAVLLQNEQPVAYASKALTPAQLNYPQIEKEAAAIRYACQKFHSYIYGKRLTIETDHKPLEIIFRKPIHTAPQRLQRILFDVMPYSPNINYKKGTSLYIADTLSRDCKNSIDPDEEELQVHIVLNMTNKAVKDMISSTEEDVELQSLISVVLNGWPNNQKEVPANVKHYWNFRDRISYYGGVLFKGTEVIIPKDQVPRILRSIHSGHFGEQKCLRLARENVYWKGMSKDIVEYIRKCSICQSMQPSKPKEPLMLKEVPNLPFEIVGVDIFYFQEQEYLLLADSYSGFFDFKKLKHSTTSEVIKKLKSWFSVHGIPVTVESDNGPQFASKEFRDFVRDWSINHRTSSPYYPRSNGLSERHVQIAKNMLKKCVKDSSDIHLALLNYRNAPRNNELGSPNQRLMSRNTRSTLPVSVTKLTPKIVEYDVKEELTRIRKNQKVYADQKTKASKEFRPGEKVRVQVGHRKWIGATVESSTDYPRSYNIRANNGKSYRRNAIHIHKTKAKIKQERKLAIDSSSNTSSIPDHEGTFRITSDNSIQPRMQSQLNNSPTSTNGEVTQPTITTRYGRIIKPPQRLDL